MAAIDTSRFALFLRNRCTTDGIYGNATATVDVADGGTLDNIFHKSPLRKAQLTGNDATISIELKGRSDVQAFHIMARLTASAIITLSSKNLPGDSYTTRKTLTLDTTAASMTAGDFMTGGLQDFDFEARKDPPVGIYTAYLTGGEQTTVLGHPFWQIRLQDPGTSGPIFVSQIFLGPIEQFLTLEGDGDLNALTENFIEDEFGDTPLEFAIQTLARTESEIADLKTDIKRLGFTKPFFVSLQPNQGSISGATNYDEKWRTLYGVFRPPVSLELLTGSGGTLRISAAIRETLR